METLRLRRMQEPSRVERLLDAYIAHGGELSDDCYQIRDPSGLPSALRKRLGPRHRTGRGLVLLGAQLAIRRRACFPNVVRRLLGPTGGLDPRWGHFLLG